VWLANREERRRANSSTHTHGDPRRRQDRTFYDAVWSHLPTEKEAAQGRRGGFLAIHAGEWSDASREKYNRTLRKHAAPLHQMRCSEIGQNDIVAVLSPIWTGPSWGQGTMLRGLIERVLMQEGRNPNPAAHKVESATAASYGATLLREGERRELMDAWAKFCTGH
jgi:hypothetical protein